MYLLGRFYFWIQMDTNWIDPFILAFTHHQHDLRRKSNSIQQTARL